MNRNVLLTIEYDGINFSGWQRQQDKRTVQGELEEVLSLVCKTPVQLNGTSRTDAGVHALGQRASFVADFGIPVEKLADVVNNLLAGGQNSRTKGSDIKIISVEEKPMDFHARFDSRGKLYRYVIDNSGTRNIFRRNYTYSVKEPLNIDDMRRAADFIVGTHDFKCFEASGSNPRKTTVRTINFLDIRKDEDDIVVEVAGDGFLYNMVRIIVGTLVEVGIGKIHPMAIESIINSKDRQNAGHTAPPEGLYLVEVYYSQGTGETV